MATIYEENLQLPPIFGRSGQPAPIDLQEKDLTLPPVLNGDAPSIGMPTEKPLELPPTIRMG